MWVPCPKCLVDFRIVAPREFAGGVLTAWFAMLQNELDGIRSELASLRQAIGKNRSADGVSNGTVNRNGGLPDGDAMPGGNMVSNMV